MSQQAKVLLELFSVSRFFPGVKALDDVSFDVVAGEVHGLVGENGAGKSTLMAVASGALAASEGLVRIDGTEMKADPDLAKDLGLAIVRQEPSLMPDLTVAENFYLGMPEHRRPPLATVNQWARGLLTTWRDEPTVGVRDRVNSLNPEQRFIVEIVKALACDPKVLVMDEPTEHLPAEDVGRLFARIRELTGRGAAVVYISHRIREVQQIANRLTVLRDGMSQGTYVASLLTEDQIVELIVGVSLDREFPPKAASAAGSSVVLEVKSLSGTGFQNVDIQIRRGEILGLAGIDANGQREFMRALAGLNKGRGSVLLDGKSARIDKPRAAVASGIRYVPGDRHRESIFADLSVRENFSLRSLVRDTKRGLIDRSAEVGRASEAFAQFDVKTPTVETPIGSLSGGNQQKLVLSSVLASGPRLILVDEPTQGVDVGTRTEIYKVLRQTAAKGIPIIVLSSDAMEVAGLCDRVMIFSRGRVVDTLAGADVTENNITSLVLKSTSVRDKLAGTVGGFWRWAADDWAPLLMVAAAIVLMGLFATSMNEFYLTSRNLGGMLVLIATLALVAYGQQMLMLIGGIDLSVGPLMGLVQVVASFWLLPDSGAVHQIVGMAVILAVVLLAGLLNWFLVDPIGLHPMVATLATYMGFQAVSLLLRPTPAGMIDQDFMDLIGVRFGAVPATAAVAAGIALALEFWLYRRKQGLFFRGLGSRAEAARVAGVSPRRTKLLAYVGCSLLAGIAAVTMISQVGIGAPTAGIGYTLSSIAAVVIGGASLFGGRGSFVGSLLGAVFITQVDTVTTFLELDAAWQSYLLGGMILAAVAVYSKSRQMAVAA